MPELAPTPRIRKQIAGSQRDSRIGELRLKLDQLRNGPHAPQVAQPKQQGCVRFHLAQCAHDLGVITRLRDVSFGFEEHAIEAVFRHLVKEADKASRRAAQQVPEKRESIRDCFDDPVQHGIIGAEACDRGS